MDQPVTETNVQSASPTPRELQLEFQIWQERAHRINAQAELLKANSALLQKEGVECNENLARLQALLTPKPAPTPPPAVAEAPIAA